MDLISLIQWKYPGFYPGRDFTVESLNGALAITGWSIPAPQPSVIDLASWAAAKTASEASAALAQQLAAAKAARLAQGITVSGITFPADDASIKQNQLYQTQIQNRMARYNGTASAFFALDLFTVTGRKIQDINGVGRTMTLGQLYDGLTVYFQKVLAIYDATTITAVQAVV